MKGQPCVQAEDSSVDENAWLSSEHAGVDREGWGNLHSQRTHGHPGVCKPSGEPLQPSPVCNREHQAAAHAAFPIRPHLLGETGSTSASPFLGRRVVAADILGI